MALPTLNNNIANYMSWKINQNASISRLFGEKNFVNTDYDGDYSAKVDE